MRAALLVIAGLALIGYVAVAWVLPSMAGSEVRAAAQALVAGAEPAKQQVAARAEKSGNLAGAGNGVKLVEKEDPRHGKMKWIVADNGAIRAWNERNALEVTFTPSLQGGKTSWSCKGYPVGAMPASCGGKI
ncbi:MAG TPA: hypothetical protein VHI32_14970 [Burkholderiales bacterium]|jgi:hypothetical protein|nr:hypothetical protein [Burkholderiales bacterium]